MDGQEAPRITVLINAFNYAHFLPRAIDSALAQEYIGPPIEVLVVDDGSTDETAEVAARYGNRIRYIAKENGGQASALNLGFRQARGDVVCLMDADDYFYPRKVQAVADLFQRRPEVGFVYDEFDIVDRAGASLHKVYPEPTWSGYRVPLSRVPVQLRDLILLGHPWTCITSAMSLRRAILADLEVPEDLFRQSADLFLGLVVPFLTEVAIVETRGTAYVYHGANMELFRSSAANRALYQEQLDSIRRFVEERFSVRFLRYGGRSIYSPECETSLGTHRLSTLVQESRHITAAAVEPVIKRHSYARLIAALLLPNVLYVMVRERKARYDRWRSRRFRRRIAEAGSAEW